MVRAALSDPLWYQTPPKLSEYCASKKVGPIAIKSIETKRQRKKLLCRIVHNFAGAICQRMTLPSAFAKVEEIIV